MTALSIRHSAILDSADAVELTRGASVVDFQPFSMRRSPAARSNGRDFKEETGAVVKAMTGDASE